MTARLVHLRGECWLTAADYAAHLAAIENAPPLNAEQRTRLRTLLRNDRSERYADGPTRRAADGGNQRLTKPRSVPGEGTAKARNVRDA